MTTITTAAATTAPAPRFPQTLAAEWAKLWGLRSTWATVTLAVLLSVGVSALVALMNANPGPSAEEVASVGVGNLLSGGLIGDLALMTLGVLTVTGDYATGMIRTTLTATPRRGRVLLAKAAVVTIVVLAAGAAATLGMFLAAQAVLDAHGVSSPPLSDPAVQRFLLVRVAAGPVMPLLGAALGFLFRSTAGAVSSALGFMFVPGIMGELLPDWWKEYVLRFLPASAADSLAASVPPEGSLTYLPPGPALAVIAAWLVVSLTVAYASLRLRDA